MEEVSVEENCRLKTRERASQPVFAKHVKVIASGLSLSTEKGEDACPPPFVY